MCVKAKLSATIGPWVISRALVFRRSSMQPDKVDPTAAVQDYDALCEKLKEISTLNGVSGLLMWDEMVCNLLFIPCTVSVDTFVPAVLNHTSSMQSKKELLWHQVMMPEGAAEVRASQKSILTGIVYDKVCHALSPNLSCLFSNCASIVINSIMPLEAGTCLTC